MRDDGTVKVLDFGLAKAIESIETAGTGASMSPTITSPAVTRLGVILGTAAYMSPEQAKGRAADRRADVWAFGAVLYEMLTGRRAFDGEGVSETLANVMHVEPAWEALPAGLAPSVVALLRRCLAKDPKKRMRDIGDVGLALDGAFDLPVPASERAPLRMRVALIAGVIVLASAVGAFTLMRLQPSSEPEPIRFSYALPGGRVFRGGDRQIVAIAPDGRRFAYNATGGLYVRKMDEEEPRLIPGTEQGLDEPVFSPDGGSLAYFQDGAVKKVRVDGGGAPVPLGSAQLRRSAFRSAQIGASATRSCGVQAMVSGKFRVTAAYPSGLSSRRKESNCPIRSCSRAVNGCCSRHAVAAAVLPSRSR